MGHAVVIINNRGSRVAPLKPKTEQKGVESLMEFLAEFLQVIYWALQVVIALKTLIG